MPDNVPIPEQILREVHQRIPNLNHLIMKLREAKGGGLTDWADWCFLPVSAWRAIAQTAADGDEMAILSMFAAAAGTWQFSKGIYQFDPDFLVELLSSPLVSDMPSDVLLRLPEYCIYFDIASSLETFPELAEYLLHGGFFVYLEDDTHNDRRELRFFVPDRGSVPLHLGHWSVDVAIDRFVSESTKYIPTEAAERVRNKQDELVEYLYRIYSRLINLVLYICSNEPDIQTDRQPGYSHYRPEPVKTKKGLRLFPADKVHIHNVGTTVGQLLRREDSGAETEPIEWKGGTKRAHLRRGHWHGYWKGSRKSYEREFIFHWLPPLIAGGKR